MNEYTQGSVTNYDPAVRAQAVEHLLECVQIMRDTDSKVLSLGWLTEQTTWVRAIFAAEENLLESLRSVYKELRADERILIEYKMFEPPSITPISATGEWQRF